MSVDAFPSPPSPVERGQQRGAAHQPDHNPGLGHRLRRRSANREWLLEADVREAEELVLNWNRQAEKTSVRL
jgi:hypothetical protein